MLKKLLRTKKEWVAGIKKYQTKEEKGVLEMCRKCFAFKYSNGWHFERPEHLLKSDADERVSVRFSQCPACIEEALAMYDIEYIQRIHEY